MYTFLIQCIKYILFNTIISAHIHLSSGGSKCATYIKDQNAFLAAL